MAQLIVFVSFSLPLLFVVVVAATSHLFSMVESLFKFVAPLMKDQSDTIPYEDLVESDREQFAVEQRLVGRLISLIRHGTLQAVVQHHLHCWHSKKKRLTMWPRVFFTLFLHCFLLFECSLILFPNRRRRTIVSNLYSRQKTFWQRWYESYSVHIGTIGLWVHWFSGTFEKKLCLSRPQKRKQQPRRRGTFRSRQRYIFFGFSPFFLCSFVPLFLCSFVPFFLFSRGH